MPEATATATTTPTRPYQPVTVDDARAIAMQRDKAAIAIVARDAEHGRCDVTAYAAPGHPLSGASEAIAAATRIAELEGEVHRLRIALHNVRGMAEHDVLFGRTLHNSFTRQIEADAAAALEGRAL